MKPTTILLVLIGGVLVYELVLKPKPAQVSQNPLTGTVTAFANLGTTIAGWFNQGNGAQADGSYSIASFDNQDIGANDPTYP